MKRIAIGAVTGLAVWFGSALAAEAQQITPTGPLSINAGDMSTTFTANVTLPYANYFYVNLIVTESGVPVYSVRKFFPNQGTTTPSISIPVPFNVPAIGGTTFRFQNCLIFAGSPKDGGDLLVLVPGTRPPSKVTSVKKSGTLAIQAVDRDRRRE